MIKISFLVLSNLYCTTSVESNQMYPFDEASLYVVKSYPGGSPKLQVEL